MAFQAGLKAVSKLVSHTDDTIKVQKFFDMGGLKVFGGADNVSKTAMNAKIHKSMVEAKAAYAKGSQDLVEINGKKYFQFTSADGTHIQIAENLIDTKGLNGLQRFGKGIQRSYYYVLANLRAALGKVGIDIAKTGDNAIAQVTKKSKIANEANQTAITKVFGKNKTYSEIIDAATKQEGLDFTPSTATIATGKSGILRTKQSLNMEMHHFGHQNALFAGTKLSDSGVIMYKMDKNLALLGLKHNNKAHKAIIDQLKEGSAIKYSTLKNGDDIHAVLDHIDFVKAGEGVSKELAAKINNHIFNNIQATLKTVKIKGIKIPAETTGIDMLENLHQAGIPLEKVIDTSKINQLELLYDLGNMRGPAAEITEAASKKLTKLQTELAELNKKAGELANGAVGKETLLQQAKNREASIAQVEKTIAGYNEQQATANEVYSRVLETLKNLETPAATSVAKTG